MAKQVIVVRGDLDLPTGKLASQVAHASLEAALQAPEVVRRSWRRDGAKKVVVRCEDEEELRRLEEACDEADLPHHVVQDAGHTVVKPGTATALGVGPGEGEAVDDVTGSLPLL